MVKCDHCHQRRGKRACPFLHGHICSSCCGENRGVRFDCPRDCPYFVFPAPAGEPGAAEAAAAQGRRAGSGAGETAGDSAGRAHVAQGAPAEPAPDLSRYQKFLSSDRRALADLMARLEFAIARFDRERRGLTDADATQALEYMRRRASPIVAVERFAPEMGDFLERALAEMQRGLPALRPYDMIEILDHLIGVVRNFGPPGSRRYLDEVALLEKRSREASGEGAPGPASRIILPP